MGFHWACVSSTIIVMALDANSKLTDALAQLNANLSWNGDYAKASLALEAVRWLLFNRPEQNSDNVRAFNYARLERLEGQLSDYVEMDAGKGRRAPFVRGRMAR